MMEMDAEAAAITSNEEDGQNTGRRSGEMDSSRGSGGGHGSAVHPKPEKDAGSTAKLTEPAKHSSVVVQDTAKSTESPHHGSEKKETDTSHSKTGGKSVGSIVSKNPPKSIDTTSELKTIAAAPDPSKNLLSSDKEPSKSALPSTKISVPSSTVPTKLPGSSSDASLKPAKASSSAGISNASKTSISSAPGSTTAVTAPGNVSASSEKMSACSSLGTHSYPAKSLCPSPVVSGTTPSVTSKPLVEKPSAKVSLTSSHSKSPGISSSVSVANNSSVPEKPAGKPEAVSKLSSQSQSAPKLHTSQPVTPSYASPSRLSHSKTPSAVSSPVVSSSTSTKPVISSTVVTKSTSPAAPPSSSHFARNASSMFSSSSVSSSSKPPQSHTPPFKPIPKIPPVMPSVKPKINPPKFSSLVSSSSLQKSTTQASSSMTSSSSAPKSPSHPSPKPSGQVSSRPSISPNIRPLMSIKVTCPSSFSSSWSSMQYSSHSSFGSSSRTLQSAPSATVTSSLSNTATSSRPGSSPSPQRVAVSPSKVTSQPPQPLSATQRPVQPHPSLAPPRSPAVPMRHSSPQQPPSEVSRPSSQANEPSPPSPPPRRDEDRAPAATDFSVPDLRRDCPPGPDPATPAASLVPDVLRTGSEEEDRHLERMLCPTPFGGGIPPPHMPDLCRREGDPVVAPARPVLPSSAEADLDLLRPASAVVSSRPQVNEPVHADQVQAQPMNVEPEAPAPLQANEPRNNGGEQGALEGGDQSTRGSSQAVGSNLENPVEAVVEGDGAATDSKSSDAGQPGTSPAKLASLPKDGSDDDKGGVSLVQALESDAGEPVKKEELSKGSKESEDSDCTLHGQDVCDEKAFSDIVEASTSNRVDSVKSDSDTSLTTERASGDSLSPEERTNDKDNADSKSSSFLKKDAPQQPGDIIGQKDMQHSLPVAAQNPQQKGASCSSTGERMTVEKAEADKDSLVGEESNSSLMIPPSSSHLSKVLVMGGEEKGREEVEQPQKKEVVKEEVRGEKEEKQVKEAPVSTIVGGSKTVKSLEVCDKPVASDVDKPVVKCLDTVSPKPPKGGSAAPYSTKVSPICDSGIVPPKDCDVADSGNVGKKVGIPQPEGSRGKVSHSLPVEKHVTKSSGSNGKNSMDISHPVVGKAVEKTLVTSGNKEQNVSGREKEGGSHLKAKSLRDSQGNSEESDQNVLKLDDLKSDKTTEAVCKKTDEKSLSKEKKIITSEVKETVEPKAHENLSKKIEMGKLPEVSMAAKEVKSDSKSDMVVIRVDNEKYVEKSACVGEQPETESSRLSDKGHSHQENSKSCEASFKLIDESDKSVSSFVVSDKKDLSVSEENKINDKHKGSKTQVDATGGRIFKVEGKPVVKEAVKVTEKVSLSNIIREPELMNETKGSQQNKLESVPRDLFLKADSENQNIPVNHDSKKKSLKQVVGCGPQSEILSKSDKNALVIYGDSTHKVDSPSQVHISSEKSTIHEEACKHEILDNNARLSLPTEGAFRETSTKLSELDSLLHREESIDDVSCKDSSDLKSIVKSEKVSKVRENLPLVSEVTASLAKSVKEDTTKKSVDSGVHLEVTEKRVDLGKLAKSKNVEAGHSSSTSENLHSISKNELCENVPGSQKEDVIISTVEGSRSTNQGNPIVSPVIDEMMRLPSTSVEEGDMKPSLRTSGASEASQRGEMLSNVNSSSIIAKTATSEADVQSPVGKTLLNQPTQVLNVVIEAVSEEGIAGTNINDVGILETIPVIKATQESLMASTTTPACQEVGASIKTDKNDDSTKVGSKTENIVSVTQVNTLPVQVNVKACISESVVQASLERDRGRNDQEYGQSSEMPLTSPKNVRKKETVGNFPSVKSSTEDTSGSLMETSVPDLRGKSEEDEKNTMQKNTAVKATMAKGKESEVASNLKHSDSNPNKLYLVSCTSKDGAFDAKNVTESELSPTKNMPDITKPEIDNVKTLKSSISSTNKQTIESHSHSMVNILSKSMSSAQMEDAVCSEKKTSDSGNGPSKETDMGRKEDVIHLKNSDQIVADNVHVNCSEGSGISKVTKPSSLKEMQIKENKNLTAETVLPEALLLEKEKQEGEENLDKHVADFELTSSSQPVKSSEEAIEKDSSGGSSDASVITPKDNLQLSLPFVVIESNTHGKETTMTLGAGIESNNHKIEFHKEEEIKPITNKTEKGSSSDQSVSSASANPCYDSVHEEKINAVEESIVEPNESGGKQNAALPLSPSIPSDDSIFAKEQTSSQSVNPVPDLLNVVNGQSFKENLNKPIKVDNDTTMLKSLSTENETPQLKNEVTKSLQNVDASTKSGEEAALKVVEVKALASTCDMQDERKCLVEVEPSIHSSADQKATSSEVKIGEVLTPNHDSELNKESKASDASQDITNLTVKEKPKLENLASALPLNDAENTDSTKLKKRGDLKHSREKSILGITEKLAVANQMRQQKQGNSEQATKESSSPKKMPGLIEMGVAKASRRKNVVVKDEQRIFKKTKVVTMADNNGGGTVRDPADPLGILGMEGPLGKSEIAPVMKQTTETSKRISNPQPEVVIDPELPVGEKTVVREEMSSNLELCTIIDLSSKSLKTFKDGNSCVKVGDSQESLVDRLTPLNVEKQLSEAANVKESDNTESSKIEGGSAVDPKDMSSFKLPRVKRNLGKDKTVGPEASSVVGPATRTRAGFKPPSPTFVKSLSKSEDSKEKTYPKVVKGSVKREDKALDIEFKRKSVEVSTEPFSKQVDTEGKRMDFVEDALSIKAINSPSSVSSSKLLEVIRVAEEKGRDIVKVNDVEVMREPVGSGSSPMSLMRKHPSGSPMFSSISVSTEGQRKDMALEPKSTSEGMQMEASSVMSKFPSGSTESWEFVAKVGEVELLRESPRVQPKATPPPVTITMEPSSKKLTREKPEAGSRKPGRPPSMPPPSKTPDYTVPAINALEQAFMAQQSLRNHSLEVLVGIGNRPSEGTMIDPRVQGPPMLMQMGPTGIPPWPLRSEALPRPSLKPSGMETYLAGRPPSTGEQVQESDNDKRKKGAKGRNAPPPRWTSQEADMLSVKVDGHPVGSWSPGDWRSMNPVNVWPHGYPGYVPPLRPRGPIEPRCSRSVSPPSHSSRDVRGVEHMPEDLSSPPLPRGRKESPHSFKHPFVYPATSSPWPSHYSDVSVMSYSMSKSSSSSALNLAKSTASPTPPSDMAMNLTMCKQSSSSLTSLPVLSSPSVQQSPRQSLPVNLVKSRSSSPKAAVQQTLQNVPESRGAVLPGGIVVPNLPLIFGRDYSLGSPSTPPSGRISHCSAEESREATDTSVGQVVRCSSEPPRDHIPDRRPRDSPNMGAFVPTSMPPKSSAACQTSQPVQNFPIPRPSSALSSLEQVPSATITRSSSTEPNLLPGGVAIPNLYGPNVLRPGEEQWNSSAVEGGKLDLPPRSASAMSQYHTEESPSKQVTPRMSTPVPSVSSTCIPPSSTPPPSAPPQKTGPGRRGGRAETPPPDKYNFRVEEAHVVRSSDILPGGGHGGAGGKLFACDICSGVYRRAFSLKRHYLRAHINYCHLSERDLSNCGIVVGDKMAVHTGGSGRRPYVHTTLPRSASKSPDEEPERGSGRRTLLRDLFRCHTCGVCFDEKKRLKAHLMEHQCGSNRPSLLRQHAAAHHLPQPTVAPRPAPLPRPHPSSPAPTVYLCAYCDKRFSSAAVRRRHRKLHESSPGPHPCYLCETAEDTPETPLRETPSFVHLEDLRSHMASVHREVYHSCALCGERLPTLLSLEEHAEEHRSHRRATEQSDEDEEEEDVELVRAAAAAVAPLPESPRQPAGIQSTSLPQGDEEEFRYTCGVCQKMFTNYVNMCRHRRLAHGAAQVKVAGRKAGTSSAGKGHVGGGDSESSSRSQSPVVVSQSSERGHRDLLDGEPSSSSSSSVPSPCPYPSSSATSANDPETIFYTRLAGNIRDNLLNYLDGKLHKQSSFDKRSKEEDSKGTGCENEVDEETKTETSWEKYNFPKDFQQMSCWDISTQLVVRNNLRRVNNTPSVEPDPEQRPAFPETLALVETSKSGQQSNKEEEEGAKEEEEETGKEGEWSGLSGEWVRPRSYICCACASKFSDLWALEDHKLARHPNVWCTHLEVEDGSVVLPGSPKLSPGSATVAVTFLGDLLCRRPLGPMGALLTAPSVPPTLNSGMESPSAKCTKCSRVCPSLPELHSHMLECGGDVAWAAWAGGSSPATSSRRNSRKWRPFGSRRRRQRGRRGMKRNIPSSPVKMHRTRHRGTDSDSIQRMIANLPAKRATRRVIQFNEDEIKTRSQATIHSVSFPGTFVRVSGYKAPLGVGVKGAPPTAAKRGRPPKNPLPPTPLNIEGMTVASTSVAILPIGATSASIAASGVSPQGIVKKGRGRPPGSKSKTTISNPDFTLKRRFGDSIGEGYSPEGDRYALGKRSRPSASPINQHQASSAVPNAPGEPYICKGCGAVFDNASSCERHGKKCVFRRQMPIMPSGDGFRSVSSGNSRPVHSCPHCGKNFTYATPMEKHVRVCGSNIGALRGPVTHVRRATAPSSLGRPAKTDEEDEMKKDMESPSPTEEIESPSSVPPQEPDMPQLQKEEPVASPPTKDDDIPVLTPVEPEEEEEEVVENIEGSLIKDIVEDKEGVILELHGPEVTITNETQVAVCDEGETKVDFSLDKLALKPCDETVIAVKEEVVEILPEPPVEESMTIPTEPAQVIPTDLPAEEEAPKEAPAEEVATEMEEWPESPEVHITGKRTRGSSSGGQVAKKNKVDEEVVEPVVEVETPKRKGGKRNVVSIMRGRSPKGVRITRGTKGEEEMTAEEGEDKEEKEEATGKEESKVEEEEKEEGGKVKTEPEEVPQQMDDDVDQNTGKEPPKTVSETESSSIDKEEEKEDLSASEGRGKRGRRGKQSKTPATPETITEAVQDKADLTPVSSRQGKRKGASVERPNSPKVEEVPASLPEIEPKVTRGSVSAQSKAAQVVEKEVTKEEKSKVSKKKEEEEEEVKKASKENKPVGVKQAEEEANLIIKKTKDDSELSKDKPEAKDSGDKVEASEEEEENPDDGKGKAGKDKLRGTKGSKGKVSKKSHKKKGKQELKREVENFWCDVCQMGYSSAFNLVKHGQSQKHKWNLRLGKEKAEAAAKEAKEKDEKKADDEVEQEKKEEGGEKKHRGDDGEGSGGGKAHEAGRKGGSGEGKEGDKTSGEEKKESGGEKGSDSKCSDGGKGEGEKKVDGEGKTGKRRSDAEVKDKDEGQDVAGDENGTDKDEEPESESMGILKGEVSGKSNGIDTKGKSVSSSEDAIIKGSSAKEKEQEKKSEKKSPEKKTPEKKSPEKKCPEKGSPEKKSQETDAKESDSASIGSETLVQKPSVDDSKEKATEKEELQEKSNEDKAKKGANVTPQLGAEESTNTTGLPDGAVDAVGNVEVSKNSAKDTADGSLIGQTVSERGVSGQGDSQPAPAQEAEGSVTKVSPEATVAAAPESATVIEGTENACEAIQFGAWAETPMVTSTQEFAPPNPVPLPTNYNPVYEWDSSVVQQAAMPQPPPLAPPPPPPPPPQQASGAPSHAHPVQQDGWGVYGGWEAPAADPNPPPSPGLWRYQPPNPTTWVEPQHSLSPIPRVPSYSEDPPPVTHPSTPSPSPPNASLGSILDSVNRILGEDVPGFDSSRIQAGATIPEDEYAGVGLFGEGSLAELQRAMGATDEEMAMLQQLGTGPLDFVYDNNALVPANMAYSSADSPDQTGPLPNAELVDLDNQPVAVSVTGGGPIEEVETAALPPVPADSSNYYDGDGRGGKRKRCGPPPSKCKKVIPPTRESNRGWRGGRRLPPTQASLASAHLLISQYEKKEMVCPMCNRHFLGLAALETHVAWVHKVKDAKQHILEGATEGQPSGKKPNPAASNTLRELVAGRTAGGVVVGGGVASSPTPSRRLPCFVCKELYSDVISLNHHIAQQHLRRRPGEGGAVPEMDGNLKSQMTSALGGLLGKALANMRSRSDANTSLQKTGLSAIANKSPLFSTFPKLNLLTKSLDAISKISPTGDSSTRKSFGGSSSSEGPAETVSRTEASADSPEVGLFRREDGMDPSEWSSDGEDSAKGQEGEGQLDEGEIPSFHHVCHYCGDRFQRLSSKNRHITWAHRDIACMDMLRMPRSCSHEGSDFDELLSRSKRDEGEGGSLAREESLEEVQETGRRHNHHPCPACQLSFLRHSQLEAHLKRAHNGSDSPLPDTSDSMMECPICRESMNNFLKLCKHVKTKHREWSINCFTTDMHHHLILRKESPEESMVIRKKFLVKMKAFPVLRMASPTPSSRSSEEESYMDPDPKGNYLCSVCGVNFKSPQGVIRHLNLEHNSNHLEGALPMQKIFPRHATKEYRSRSGGGLGSDIKAKAEAALRELNLSQKLKLGAVTSAKGVMAAKSAHSKKPNSSASDGGSDSSSVATTSKGSGRGRGGGKRGRGKRGGGGRGGAVSSDVEKSLFDVYEFEDDDDELEETPSRVGSADGSSRVGSDCGDDDEEEDVAEDDGKSGVGSAASIRGKRVSVDSSSSDAKYSCNACGKGYKSLTAFWKHTKGVRGACAGGGSSPGRSGERSCTEGTAPSPRGGSKASGGRKGSGGVGKDEEEVSSDVESEVGSGRVLRRLRGSTSGVSDVGGAEGSSEATAEASEVTGKRGEKGGRGGGKGKKKGGAVAEEEKKPLFSGGETVVRTYGGKRSSKQQAEERRGRGGGEDGDGGGGVGGSRRSLGASEAAFDALRGGGSS